MGQPAVHTLPTWSGERSAEGPYLGRQCAREDLSRSRVSGTSVTSLNSYSSSEKQVIPFLGLEG